MLQIKKNSNEYQENFQTEHTFHCSQSLEVASVAVCLASQKIWLTQPNFWTSYSELQDVCRTGEEKSAAN